MSWKKIYPVLLGVIVLFVISGTAFSQDSAENLSADSVVNAVKQAIKETDREKEEEHARLVSELRGKLDSAAQDWIKTATASRKRELNKLRHENWMLGQTINYPVPYDYYLRDFSYAITASDLNENPLLSTYKGSVNILEKLYIEAPHSKNADDISKYFYTMDRAIALDFEYKNDKFVTSGSTYKPYQVASGWKKNGQNNK